MATNFRETTGAVAASIRTDAVDVGRQVALAACGLATTFAVVGLNAWIASTASFNLLSLSVWFIVPVGALLGGAVAASGYYGGALLTQTMPTKEIAWSMVGIAAGAWFFSHWLEYASMTLDDGTRVRDTVGFWQFLQFTTEHQSLTLRTRGNTTGVGTGELGVLGYAREALQVAGFVGGGLAVYGWLVSKEACGTCRRYAKVTPVLRGVSPAQFDEAMHYIDAALPGIVEACEAALADRPFLGMNLNVAQCPACHAFWIRPEVIVQNGRDAVAVRIGRYTAGPETAGLLLGLPAAMRVPATGATA